MGVRRREWQAALVPRPVRNRDYTDVLFYEDALIAGDIMNMNDLTALTLPAREALLSELLLQADVELEFVGGAQCES